MKTQPEWIKEIQKYPNAITTNLLFVVLNKNRLNFFRNQNVNSLVKTVDLEYISIPTIIKNESEYNKFIL